MNKRKIKVSRLNYIKPEEVLIRFQDELNLIYLDSANHIISEDNRYSYLALDPIYSIKINRNEKYFNLQKFQKVKKIISEFKYKKIKSLPKFQCGLAGYISYEAGLLKEKIANAKLNENIIPSIYFGLFDIVFAFDNKLKKAFIFSSNLDKEFKLSLIHI